MTLFNLLRQRCGLSQQEAAAFCGVALRTVEDWCSGIRRSAPQGAIDELRGLYAHIEAGAVQRVAEIRRQKLEQVELSLARTAKEAQSLGLPCISAHAAMLAIVAARIDIPAAIVVPSVTRKGVCVSSVIIK